MLTFPKDTSQFGWTRHIKNKMVYYHLSGAQLLRIFRKPERREEGIAPRTVAAMISRKPSVSLKKTSALSLRGQTTDRGNPAALSFRPKSRNPISEEIWIMYKMNKKPRTKSEELKEGNTSASPIPGSKFSVLRSKSRITMISAWRYPGVTKKGERPEIPEDVLAELAGFE